MNVIFASPYPLAFAGACVAIVGAALLQNGRRTPGIVALILGVLLVPAAWAVDAARETDAERLEQITLQLVDDFKAGNLVAVQDVISDSRDDLEGYAAAGIKTITIKNDRVTDVSCEVDEKTANVRFRLNADFQIGGTAVSGGRHPTRWDLTFSRERAADGADRWQITDVAELDPINGKRRDRFKRVRSL